MEEEKLARGQALAELVKGSINYTLHLIRKAWYSQFERTIDEAGWTVHWLEEVFADYVIAKDDALATDEYYRVAYSREAGTYVFAEREAWDVVELAYQPQTALEESQAGRHRFTEVVDRAIVLLEGQDGGRWIEGTGITADVVNGNGRRYPRHVLREAVERLQGHLHESAGQGRLGQVVTGEAEHPSSKGTTHPQFLETIVNWNAGHVRFDEGMGRVVVRGRILETSKGKDAITIMEGGVMPGLSMRGYGSALMLTEDEQTIQEVTELVITGFDLLSPGMNSDPNGAIQVLESRTEPDNQGEDPEMDLEELRKQYPELVLQIEEERDAQRRAELEAELQAQADADAALQTALDEQRAQIQESLGLDGAVDLTEAWQATQQQLEELQAAERAREVAAFVESRIGELSYPEFLQAQFIEAVRQLRPETAETAQQMIETKRAEYDAIMAGIALQQKGFAAGRVVGPVIEQEAGVPRTRGLVWHSRRAWSTPDWSGTGVRHEPKYANEVFAAQYLKQFDEQYRPQLAAESKRFEEAEQTSDLNLPYSIIRAVVAEAFPELVATSIFDFGMINESPSRLYFETYTGETGYATSVTDESVTADLGAYAAMAYKRITPGTVVVQDVTDTTTYVEGTDYIIDYANGELMALAGGSISDSDVLHVDYSYTAIRKGEMQSIERGKMTLSYVTIEALADRLATQLSHEAVVFSRSQLGWDATTRTLNSLVRQVRRKVDQGILYLAVAAALSVASNSGGTWTAASDSLDDLVEHLGQAKVKVANRYYQPTAILGSVTNMDRLSNWDGFKRDGFPDAVLGSNGFVGRVKGLPVFESTEFTDSYFLLVNRELVMHRVYQTMALKGPFPTYDVSGGTSKLVAADQYFVEEYNATETPVPEKGSYVKVA